MQRRLRFLRFALIAGVIAVIAAAAPMFASGAIAPATQIQYVTNTRIDLPGVMKLFMKGGGTNTTKTVAATRSRDDSGDTSTITQCDLKRIVHLDNKAKTYYVVSFDDIMNQMLAAQKAMANAQSNAKTAKSTATMPPIKGSGELTFAVSDQEDGQTKTILNMTAKHYVQTITVKGTGTGDCASFEGTMTNEQWWVPNELAISCPFPIPAAMAGAPRGGGGGNPMAGNPCFSKFNAEAHVKAHPRDRFPLQETSSMGIGGFKFTTHTDVTSYQKMPYDPTFFDAPAGYTQVSPPTQQIPTH